MNINPIALTLIAAALTLTAGALTAWAAYIAYQRQTASGTKTREQLDFIVRHLQAEAARTGDNKALEQIIELRKQALSASPQTSEDAIKQIIAQVPRLTEEFEKLEQEQNFAAKLRRDEYRLKWEPVIHFVIEEFDRRIGVVKATNNTITVTKSEKFQIADIGQNGGNSHLVRVATFNGVELRLYCVSSQIHPHRLDRGGLTLTVKELGKNENHSAPLDVKLALDGADFHTTGAKLPVPPPGGPPLSPEMQQQFWEGLNKGIQQWLVLGNARGKSRD